MKLLTKHSDYAVRALLVIAQQKGARVSSSTIARAEHIPLQFLRHILRKLAEQGLIDAKEGVNGGFTLARAAAKIKVADVIEVFQGPVSFTECMLRAHPCINRATCPLRRQLARIENMVISTFSGITIASLLKDVEHGT